jgi:hypothetical protein
VEGGVCRAREEQCTGVKLIDVESGPTVDGASYPRRGTHGGESGRRRSALDLPRGAAALPAGAASFDGDSWPHEGRARVG